MRRTLLTVLLVLVTAVSSGAIVYHWMHRGAAARGGGAAPGDPTTSEAATPARYQCPMHPSYVSDAPGDCPICGMRLVLLEQDAGTDPRQDSMGMDMVPAGVEPAVTGPQVAGYATVNIPAHKQQYIGVRTAPVERRTLSSTITAVGRVDYDETGLSWVNTKISGWIETLHVDRTGQYVRRGQALLDIYSPELLATQEEYLLARDNLNRLEEGGALPGAIVQARSLLTDTQRRLALWDVPASAIQDLEARSAPRRTVTLEAPVSGYVVEKLVLAGDAVQPGENLLRIADLSRVWILAEIYESQAGQIRKGQAADVQIQALPGRRLQGTVDDLYPYLDPRTRTMRARIVLSNPDLELRPEMYATVQFRVPTAAPVLAVPDEAILDTGERRIAFVSLGEGSFAPRELVLGARGQGFTEVLAGLAEHEEIVVSGNFLIDSESRLKAALASMASGSGTGHRHGD